MTSKNANIKLSCYECLNYMLIIFTKAADNLLNQNRYESKPDIYQDHFLLRMQVPLVRNIDLNNHDLIKLVVCIIRKLLADDHLDSTKATCNQITLREDIHKFHKNPGTYLKNSNKDVQKIFTSYVDSLLTVKQNAGLRGQRNRKEE